MLCFLSLELGTEVASGGRVDLGRRGADVEGMIGSDGECQGPGPPLTLSHVTSSASVSTKTNPGTSSVFSQLFLLHSRFLLVKKKKLSENSACCTCACACAMVTVN